MSIRVAIAGVGNCASSLVQGVTYYKDTKDEDKIPGLMHNNFGGYRVRDIEFVTAFDVDAEKVGKDLSEAIGASQNNTIKFADVPELGVEVLRGPTYDGLGEYYREMIEESDAEPVDVAQVLRDKKVDVLISYLPVGSEEADKAYAQAAMDAGCAFVNCLPVFIGRRSSAMPACRSSATTSSRRSAPRSRTALWPACSRTAVCASTAPTSSTWAATWTS